MDNTLLKSTLYTSKELCKKGKLMPAVVKEDLEFITSAKIPWEKLEGKNILISGANGFLPAYMVETILFLNEYKFKKKANIFALVRDKDRAAARFSFYGKRKELIYIVQDVCDPIRAPRKIDFIIHAASQASPKYYGSDPAGTISANTVGTANLLNLAVKMKCEDFLFFSSSEVYSNLKKEDMPIKEHMYGLIDPTEVRSCYALGKCSGENMCFSWNYQYGVPIKIVRPFHTYGPGMRLDDGRVYADFVRDIIMEKNIKMNSDGSTRRAFCYLADATVGFFAVLLKGENAQVYNVSNEEGEISIRDLADMLVDAFPEKKLKVEIDDAAKQKGYIQSTVIGYSPDTTKLRNLGWRPQYSLKEGFLRTIKSYSEVI